MAINYKALAEFRYEIRQFLNFSEQAAREAGIEPQQHQALLTIKGQPSGPQATVKDLAERLRIQHHSAVELSDRLEANGLITKLRSGTDRRQVQLSLTSRGEKLLRGLSASHQEELRTAAPRLIAALRKAVRGGAEARGKKKAKRRRKHRK